jgi:hypothetical protein
MLFLYCGRLERVRGEIAEVQSVMVQNIGMPTHRHEASQNGSRSSAIPFVFLSRLRRYACHWNAPDAPLGLERLIVAGRE